MFQAVLTNHTPTKEGTQELYDNKLIALGDNVLVNQKYGLNNNIDRIQYIKILHLKPLLDRVDKYDTQCCLQTTDTNYILNKLNSTLK